MMNFFKASIPLFAAAAIAGCGGSAGPGLPNGTTSMPAAPSGLEGSPAALHHWVPMTTAFPLKGVSLKKLLEEQASGATIPSYTAKIKSPLDKKLYTYEIAGANPKDSNKTTELAYVPIVLVIKYPDGTVLDPTQPSCFDNVSVEDRFLQGPNFASTDLVSNGVDVGTTQLGDAFQRAEFWKWLKGPNYHTILTPASSPVVVNIDAPSNATTGTGMCPGTNHRIGVIPIQWYESQMPSIADTYVTTSQIPLLLTYNALLTNGSGACCYLGYHSAYQRFSQGTQVLATGTYLDKGIFGHRIEDINIWTHEIGELLNDPFANNATPAWGHTGQVSGCQSNLEVGDPLTGTTFMLDYNHFTYHPQELAFFSWFYRTKSIGTGGLYSFEGTFTQPQGACSS